MSSKSYRHVTYPVRCQIHALKSTGLSLRAIAKQVGYNVSTISREVRRNKGKRGYRFEQADRFARQRRAVVSRRPRKMTPELIERIKGALAVEWSPEQISGRFKLEHGIHISHEAVYRFVWADKKSGGTLYKHLRHGRKKYNRRSASKAGRGCIPGRVDIAQRPDIVDKKSRIGDWEGDTIIGAKHKGALVSLVDRHSKYTLLRHVPSKTASDVTQAILDLMVPHKTMAHTITFDNGKEFASHQILTEQLGTEIYFARPYHSWERGLNEHTNGLVRQYLPKAASFDTLTQEEVEAIQHRLNHRPRKELGYRTPHEVFTSSRPTSPPCVALHC